jgi:hypothetical protein
LARAMEIFKVVPPPRRSRGFSRGKTDRNCRTDIGYVPTPNVPDSEVWSVEKALDAVPSSRPTENSSSPLPFFHMLERLKTTKREGWRRFGILK